MRLLSLFVLSMIISTFAFAKDGDDRCTVGGPVTYSLSQARLALESAVVDKTTYASVSKYAAVDASKGDAEVVGDAFEVIAKDDSMSLIDKDETTISNTVNLATASILNKLSGQDLSVTENHQLAEPLQPSDGQYTYTDIKDYWLQMSDEELVEAGELRLLNKCYIGDANQSSCTDCACGNYVKGNDGGLPSGTGCSVKSQNTFGGKNIIDYCFSGYTTSMCTSDLTANKAEQLRDGIRDVDDPCDIAGYAAKLNETVVGLNYEAAEATYTFAYDSSGKIKCFASVTVDSANNLSSALFTTDGADGNVLVSIDQKFCQRFYMRKYKLGLVEGASVTVPEIAATLTPEMEVAEQTQTTLAHMSKDQIKQKYNMLQPLDGSTHDEATQNTVSKQIPIEYVAGMTAGRLEVFQSDTVMVEGTVDPSAVSESCPLAE